jgi:hypothetical protein
MKTNQSTSKQQEELRVITLPKMEKVMLLLQEQVRQMVTQANGDGPAPINYRSKATNQKAVIEFFGSGFNLTINLTQPRL